MSAPKWWQPLKLSVMYTPARLRMHRKKWKGTKVGVRNNYFQPHAVLATTFKILDTLPFSILYLPPVLHSLDFDALGKSRSCAAPRNPLIID